MLALWCSQKFPLYNVIDRSEVESPLRWNKWIPTDLRRYDQVKFHELKFNAGLHTKRCFKALRPSSQATIAGLPHDLERLLAQTSLKTCGGLLFKWIVSEGKKWKWFMQEFISLSSDAQGHARIRPSWEWTMSSQVTRTQFFPLPTEIMWHNQSAETSLES